MAVGLGTGLVVAAGVVAVEVTAAPDAAAASLAPFGSCEELTSWYRDAALPQVTAYGLGGEYGVAVEEAAADSSVGGGDAAGGAVATARDGSAAAAVGSSDTGTNVQEAGVDEPARVKTTDGLAYTLSGDRLVVVDLAAGRVRGAVDLDPTGGAPAEGLAPELLEPQRWFSELLLVGDRVVVLGSGTLPAPEGAPTGGMVGGDAMVPWWGPPTTTATTVDVSDPSTPVVVDEVEVEGGYVSARASGGDVRLVTTSTPVLPFVDPWRLQQPAPSLDGTTDDRAPVDPGPSGEAEALERNQDVVRTATAADWLPDLVERDAAGQVTTTTPVDCGAVAHPGEQAGTGTITVLTLDPSAGSTLLGTTSVSADGSMVYASTDRLYVATTQGGWWWGGAGDEVRTDLHGFDTSAPGRTDYVGSGGVDGWLLGPWALDVHDGYLRVGTTVRAPSGAEGGPGGAAGDLARPAPAPGGTSSSVVVLDEVDGGLVEVGRVDGLGPDEQIRALRWFDDLAVVVTFEQTDPLYTVDLADPAEPRVLGELKVLGYSAYLHPVGDDLLLGVGQDGTADGALLGAKVETYDVADLAAPGAVASLVWPDSSSAVEWDSRQFAYLPGSRTAVLPLERYTGETYGSGLVAVAVGEDGSVRESGTWTSEDGGWVGGLASTEDLVLVTQERWQEDTGAPTTVLTVLDADGLDERFVVDLG